MIAKRGAVTGDEKLAVLNCRRLPGRLNSSETALLLGVQDHDIPVLVAAGLIKPLGRPASNAPKYFASVEIVARTESPSWLSDATRTLAKHWMTKNRRKRADGLARSVEPALTP